MKQTVLFQGDSITDACRIRDANDSLTLTLGPSYAGKIAGRLQLDHPEIEWNFYNFGISGDRIVDLYARWKRDALNLKPDVLSILVGINDTWHEHNLSPNGVEVPRARKVYHDLLTWTKDVLPNVRLVLLEPFLLPAEDKLSWCPEVKERQIYTRELAEEFGAIFVPLQKPLDDYCEKAPWQCFSPDGVHPSPAGHQIIADEWLKAVKF